ncbi:uncharacterized protein Z520_06874 [Fonsecaea multimorphosa CBS 102226]|uniref:Heterokaryon incompatibility domain-containing protein n=1 Tax=Fonsecaea multimorphosa CBS 102226 TaxID=1442371 RepID=A0A0D2JVD1_9EURO|nr:uncharacterized protein Z520_06874 [Fonsecaea multimorphosa CBS 102226]KIX97422.1 hypothetical protein Z520_06874 [Fonsecaea multimorphosa CBS 102226]OAL23389.1 hypothetical protein AYO22_06439 [Fonsecaea multimorphosa]
MDFTVATSPQESSEGSCQWGVLQQQSLEDLEASGFCYPADTKPRQFRFIDAHAFVHDRRLDIVYATTPTQFKYCAISYVWHGLRPFSRRNAVFNIKHIRDADPVNIDILDHACELTIRKGGRYLWLDLVSIIQQSEDDKNWQIQQMAEVYRHCICCIVLPGGLQRLARLRSREPTPWMTRHWTFQEAALPPDAQCLFHWNLGSGFISGWIRITKLTDLLKMNLSNTEVGQNFVSDSGSSFVLSLSSTMRLADGVLGPSRMRNTLLAAMGTDRDLRENAIWGTIFLRSGTIPADAIFSTMGLLGINLEPLTNFTGPNGRLAATIRLAQEYLKRNGKAHWLSLVVTRVLDPQLRQILYYHPKNWASRSTGMWPILDRRMCTIPHEVQGQLDPYGGQVSIGTLAIASRTGWFGTSIRLANPPTGTLDDAGYLEINVPSMLLLAGSSRPWRYEDIVHDDPNIPDTYLPDSKDYWLIVLGSVLETHEHEAYQNIVEGEVGFVLDEHGTDRWHIVKVVVLSQPDRYRHLLRNRSFAIGGPEPINDLFT